MSFHGCPIEPSDWSDGPDEYTLCEACGGEGTEVDGTPCVKCDGKGYIDPADYEPLEDDVI